jgi:hypothetical protein
VFTLGLSGFGLWWGVAQPRLGGQSLSAACSSCRRRVAGLLGRPMRSNLGTCNRVIRGDA